MGKITGLSSSEVKDRQQTAGYNEIETTKSSSILALIITVFREPMILLLFLIALVYIFLGEAQDSIALGISVLFVVGITLYQERKTQRALEALRDLSSPHATVIRGGEHQRIPSREVVVDDIIVLEEGSRIVADAELISAQNILCDESLLTGESLPIIKSVGGVSNNVVYSGSLMVQGSGVAKVVAIGYQTEIGKIGKSLQTVVDSEPLLKLEINQIVRIFGAVGLACCIIVFLSYYYLTSDFLVSLLRGLTLSMSMLPEEFPVVLTIFLALGAWRISKNNVLTRNNQAIETLGATTVLCVDKTGTLTSNNMELVSLLTHDTSENELLTYAKLASKRSAFDPLEKEINKKYLSKFDQNNREFDDWHLKHTYNLSKETLALTRVWQSKIGSDYILSSKGAPETIMSLCGLSKSATKKWMDKMTILASKGQRVLGVAKGTYRGDKFPATQRELIYEFLGLIGFVDPLRSSVPASMQECHKAGIRVIMITGDYPGTATSIATQAGILHPDKFITGAELETLSIADISKLIKDVNIFARVIPEQKLKIVEALKLRGEIVAMTGDGINDAPALKSAHIGIAMGEKGTDVARESADLILLDDNFSSIVAAIKMGRRIYDNLQKATSYIYSIHIPIALLAILPIFLNLPPVLYPLHIAFLELVIDPASSIIFEVEQEEDDIMARPPRNLSSPLFDKSHIFYGLLDGLIILGFSLGSYLFALTSGVVEPSARFIAFITLVLCNLVLVRAKLTHFSIFKSWTNSHNNSFWIISTITTLSLFIIFSFPQMSALFHFAPIEWPYLFYLIGIVITCYLLLELLKLFKVKNVVVK
ncbi:MAG: cation-translocating P-type ATPase [bacterium]